MYEQHFKQDPYTKEKYPQSIYHDSKNLKWHGNKTITRRGAEIRVTGQEKYGNDILRPGMLYLKLKRCPYSRAKVTSIDTSKAKVLPGVVVVLTNEDVPNLVNAAPYAYCLQKEIWCSGDAVAAVAATEEDIAEEALDLITVQYEQLPFVLHPDDAAKPGAPILHGDTNEIGSPAIVTRGDVDAGFAAADKVVSTTVRRVTKPYAGGRPVAPIENESMTAAWENERMQIWSSTQSPWGDLRSVASACGLPYNRVNANNCRMGVGWGNKGSDGAGKKLAGYISMMTGHPVKWYQDNDGYFSMNSSSWTNQIHEMKAGVKNDGTITAIKDIGTGQGGYLGNRALESSMQPFMTRMTTANLYTEAHDYWTNTQSAGIPKCVAHPSGSMAFANLMDRCAEAINMNPADFLLKNIFTGSGLGGHPDYPQYDIGANPAPQYLQQLIDMSGFKSKWKGWKTPVSENGPKKRGIGISMHNCSHGSLSNPETATVILDPDGTARVVAGSQDCGQGQFTVGAIQAAEELGMSLDKVQNPPFDTQNVQESRSPGGSTVVRGTGTAIILACRDAKEQLFRLAIATKKITATSPDELETADDAIYLKADPTKKVNIKDVCALMTSNYVDAATGTTFGGPIIGRGSYATKRSGGTMMNMQHSATVAEVEVDTDTGEVTVLKVYEVAADGRTVFWKGEISQIMAGIIQQCGTVYEGITKDETTGIDLNPNYSYYKIPTMADTPEMEIDTYNEIEPYGPFGAKGSGEPVMPSTEGSIANAIYNACGARMDSSRMAPDKILAALGKA
jgi:CO/xanthine dehydrogenase Mo-binding subunit